MNQNIHNSCMNLLQDAENARMCAIPNSKQVAAHLRYLARRKEVLKPHPGLFIRTKYWESLGTIERQQHLMRALTLKHPRMVFCGVSAACAYGLSVPYERINRLEILTPQEAPVHSSHYFKRHCTHDMSDIIVNGIRVTPSIRTVFDCARWLPFMQAVAITDSALKAFKITAVQLDRLFLRKFKGLKHIRFACRTALFANEKSESPLESMARAAFDLLGFAAPKLQQCVNDPLTGYTWRPDFTWQLPNGKVIYGESDGLQKYVNPEMLNGKSMVEIFAEERQREARLTIGGQAVMRFTFHQVKNLRYMKRLMNAYQIPLKTGIVPP